MCRARGVRAHRGCAGELNGAAGAHGRTAPGGAGGPWCVMPALGPVRGSPRGWGVRRCPALLGPAPGCGVLTASAAGLGAGWITHGTCGGVRARRAWGGESSCGSGAGGKRRGRCVRWCRAAVGPSRRWAMCPVCAAPRGRGALPRGPVWVGAGAPVAGAGPPGSWPRRAGLLGAASAAGLGAGVCHGRGVRGGVRARRAAASRGGGPPPLPVLGRGGDHRVCGP